MEGVAVVDMKLEVVVVPIANVDRGKHSIDSFSDPDADGWLLQEITKRLAGR